jgi:hypothetical protein
VLDKVLESRTFLVGNSVTLADVVMVCNLSPGMKNLFDAKFRAAFPSLCRYYATVANQPQVVKVLGEFALCEKTLTYSRTRARARARGGGSAGGQALVWRATARALTRAPPLRAPRVRVLRSAQEGGQAQGCARGGEAQACAQEGR